ncbi:MAG: hypothetical protein WC124_02070 [Desulfoplanes sp.]
MATYTDGYCAIYDYDFSSIVYKEGVDLSGGAAAVEEIPVAGRNYADVRSKGRQPKRYKVKARSKDRDEIEIFFRTCNTLPVDAEFYPFDAERSGYVASAHASLVGPRKWGTGQNFYEAVAEIVCREAWLCGPDQGIDFLWWEPLPSVSALLTNNGHERSPISYMQCSGDYAGGYVEDLSVRITTESSTTKRDRELALCDKLLRADLFELGWRGEARHTYDQDFGKPLSEISVDLHGLTSGGAWSANRLCLSNGDYLMVPFYGPLPVSGDAGAVSLQLDIESIGGTGGAVQVAEEIDLSDMSEVAHDDLVVGSQIIPIPDMEGKGLVAIGIKADADPFEPFAGPTFGNCQDIAVAADGSLYAISDLGHLWSWTATGGWILESNSKNLLKVSVGLDGSVVAMSADGIEVWTGGDNWTSIATPGINDIAAISNIYIFVIGADDNVYSTQNSGGTWADHSHSAKRIVINSVGAYIVGLDDVPYFMPGWSGTSWTGLGGSGAMGIAAAGGVCYVSNSVGTVWKYDGTWAQVAGPTGIVELDCSWDGILAGTTASASVWQRPYILLSRIKGVVNRYIAPSKIPWSDPDETFKIRIESSNNGRTRFSQACWNNRYWY